MIEEIVVTAQRREERLHDVPVSMSALDSEFLHQQGVTDLQDVARYVPNVRVDIAGSEILPRIRGFSTRTIFTRGLEMPVGIAIDEVPYARADYFASGLFDLDRVEVLRGPQGQLFGANTTVGLLNLTTKNPTDKFTALIDGQVGDLGRRRFEGAVGGPLLPGFLNFRIAGLTDEQDGYVRNTTASIVPGIDSVLGGRLRRSGRAKLDFPNLFGGSLLLSYQRDHLDFQGGPREITFLPRKYHSFLRAYDPNADFTPFNYVTSLDTPGFRNADIDTLSAKGRYDLGGWGLNLLVGWSGLDSHSQDDPDGTPVPIVTTIEHEKARQTTFEFRVESPSLAGFFGVGKLIGLPLGSTDFTSGFFFQRRTLSPVDTRVNADASALLLATALGNSKVPPDQDVPVTKPPPDPEFFTNGFEQTADEFAGFGQMNWHFLDRWTLLYGMRLDGITKDAATIQKVTGTVLSQFVAAFDNENQRDREFHFSPKVGMKYDWTDDLNLYWNWSTNFQAGGFSNTGTGADPATRTVAPANVKDWEVGTKMRLLDGAAELNLGGFWMTMTDFQLFTIDNKGAVPVSTVVNVGKLRSRGVEADSTWFPTSWLTLRGSLGFDDAVYLSFPLGTCFSDRPGPGGVCELAGRPLEQAPHWETSVTPSVRVPLTSIPGFGGILPSFLTKVDLTQALTVQWTDNRYLNDSDDPRTRQPSFFLLDGNVGLANASRGWSLQFRVENLTNEKTANFSFETQTVAGGAEKATNPPRVMYGALRWEF